MNPRMHLIKTLTRCGKRFAVKSVPPKSAQRHAQFIALSGITQVELALEDSGSRIETFFGKFVCRLQLDLAEYVLGVRRLEPIEWAELGANVVVQHIGAEKTKR